jgi:hypothetical protein
MSLISKAFASDCGESFYSRERDARPDTVHATLIGLCREFIMRLHITERRAAGAEMEALSDEQVRDVLLTLQPSGGRPHGEDVTRCGKQPHGLGGRPPARDLLEAHEVGESQFDSDQL